MVFDFHSIISFFYLLHSIYICLHSGPSPIIMSSEERSRQPSTVSTFDLEPNPFEQSFASTKKALSLPGTVPHPSLPKDPSRNNSISALTQHSQRSTNSLNSIPEENGNGTVVDNTNHNEMKRDSPS